MNPQEHFLIWTPPVDYDFDLDTELANLHEATALLDDALTTGEGTAKS